MFDWVVVGGCAVGVARGFSDPRCAENRVQSREPKKIGKWGGCNTLAFKQMAGMCILVIWVLVKTNLDPLERFLKNVDFALPI